MRRAEWNNGIALGDVAATWIIAFLIAAETILLGGCFCFL